MFYLFIFILAFFFFIYVVLFFREKRPPSFLMFSCKCLEQADPKEPLDDCDLFIQE